jgi:CheY-like chemotaxis protein
LKPTDKGGLNMSTKKILIIDDDEDFTIAMRTLLEGENYEVSEAASGKEGLQKLKEFEPDLIVLDIMMETPVEGYALNQIIRFQDEYEKYRDVIIVMVSSIQDDPLSRFPHALEADMISPDYYFTKPVDVPKFKNLINKLLKK